MTFKTARIALLEARMSGEMADLIRRAGGGETISVPAVREVPRDSKQEVAAFLEHLADGSMRIVIFFTGVGVKALYTEAERLGRQEELTSLLQQATVVCRGPKPSAVVRKYNIPIAASAKEPYTTSELLQALEPFDVAGQLIGVVHYGEYSAQLAQVLRPKGADLEELCLYKWELPEDISGLENLVNDIVSRRIDAVMFTSQVQIRHLFQVATNLNLAEQLKEALNTQTIVASVGPTCNGVLANYGVTPHVVPDHPKMGHLVKALATYMG